MYACLTCVVEASGPRVDGVAARHRRNRRESKRPRRWRRGSANPISTPSPRSPRQSKGRRGTHRVELARVRKRSLTCKRPEARRVEVRWIQIFHGGNRSRRYMGISSSHMRKGRRPPQNPVTGREAGPVLVQTVHAQLRYEFRSSRQVTPLGKRDIQTVVT